METEPRFAVGDTVALRYGRELLVGRVRDAAREAPDAAEWLYPLLLADGRRFPAYERELRPGGVG